MSRAHETTVSPDDFTLPAGNSMRRLPMIGGVVGVIGLAATAGLGISSPKQFYHSWLVAFMYCLSIAVGGLFFVLSHYLTKARWSVVVRRLAETIMATLPWFIPLFVPVWFGIHDLFHWSHADAVAHDPLLAGKQGYLNVSFFTVRAVVYLLCWTGLSWFFLRGSQQQDATGDEAVLKRMIRLSAPATFVFAITVSFAAIDWIMTLDPHWYSTIFGIYFFSGSLVGCFAVMILLGMALQGSGVLGQVITVEHYHDLGKLLFAFTVFWAYIAFSQFFLIWYGNIPEETVWYLHRLEGSWKPITLLLALGHFAVPFFFLMSRNIKRRRPLLMLGCLWMLLMHLIDLHWLIMPNLHKHGAHPSLLDVTSLLGIGGLFLAVIGWQLQRRPLVPLRDSRLDESVAFENF